MSEPAALTAALAPLHGPIGLLNAGLVYLLVSLLVAATWSWQVGLFAALLNLTFDFFFVPPRYTFTAEDPKNAFALVVFLIVALIDQGTLLTTRRLEAALP